MLLSLVSLQAFKTVARNLTNDKRVSQLADDTRPKYLDLGIGLRDNQMGRIGPRDNG